MWSVAAVHRRAVDHRNVHGTSSTLSFATPNLIRHIFPHPPLPFIVPIYVDTYIACP
jgi:hypothetical protein